MKIEDISIKEGQDFKISIKPDNDCDRFSINIGHDSENIALHFNPRFDDSVIVCNSMSGGSWGDEQRDGNLCFEQGNESKFSINFNYEEFFIRLPDGSMISFPNRLGDGKYTYFDVRGEAKIISLKLR
ncbi:lectin, galactoside-binding, soluble, 2b [Stigmatopora argus]